MLIARDRVAFWTSICQISIDLCNLIEQIVIYFIVKAESEGDKYEQRLFFFVILTIGLLSNVPSVSSHPVFQAIGSMTVEFGELLAYLFLLEHSINVFLVAFLSFTFEFLCHSMQIYLEFNAVKSKQPRFVFGQTSCGRVKYVALRCASYCVFDATSILFLFLKKESRFHQPFYEILILLTFYFPSIALGPAVESITKYTHEYEEGQVPQLTILLGWSLFCATTYFIMYSVPLSITGIYFAIQELREILTDSGYDYVVYLSSLVFFGLAILIFPPFMVWWWKFTFQRFKKMRIEAKQRLNRLEDEESTPQSL